MARTWWWVVVPAAEQNAGSVPADAKVISTPEGSAQYNTLLNTDSGSVNVGGHPYVRYMGPFPTRADAVSAKPGPYSPIPGVSINPDGSVQGPLSGLAAVGDFFTRLTQAHTWLRVAEFVVGGIFLVIGLNAILHNPAGKAAGAIPKVVPV